MNIISKNWQEVWELYGVSEKDYNNICKKKGINIADNLILGKKDDYGIMHIQVAIRKKEREGTKKKLQEYLICQGFTRIYPN